MLSVLWAAWTALPLRAAPPAYTDHTVRIALAQKTDALTLHPEGDFILRDKEGTQTLKAGGKYTVKGFPRGLRLGEEPLSGAARLEPQEPGSALQVANKRFRGKLFLRPDGEGNLTAIAEMSMENYLLGVLPYEMEPDWPLEALKAQAVVARTFAYYNLGKYQKEGFDLTADTRSQVYGGLGRESLLVRQAVSSTRGEVLGYGGKLLDVYYHACCGGQTADAAQAWGGAVASLKPLRGVRDRYCARSPHLRWRLFVDQTALLAAAAGDRLLAGPIRWVRVAARDKQGDVKTLSLRAGAEILTLKTAALRDSLGASELKSPRLTSVKQGKKGVALEGRGSGHGVGLCQWGARQQALQGRGYERILGFYFPGSVLSVVDE